MMSIPAGVADIPRNPVLLEVESIDRRYLNVYVPQPQRELGVVSFFRYHRPCPAPSSALRGPMTHRLAAAIQPFVQQQGIPLVAFAKGQRKDDVARHPLAGFQQDGVRNASQGSFNPQLSLMCRAAGSNFR